MLESLEKIHKFGIEPESMTSELYRRAAECYEQSEMWREAATCWTEYGDKIRAADTYLRLEDYTSAAKLLIDQNRLPEALQSYRHLLDRTNPDDDVRMVHALLGIAACLFLMKSEHSEATKLYWKARAIIEKHTEQKFSELSQRNLPKEIGNLKAELDNIVKEKEATISRLDFEKTAILRDRQRKLQKKIETIWEEWTQREKSKGDDPNLRLHAGRCWEALGVYGTMLGRYDLVQIGYERALAMFSERNQGERVRAAQDYLAAVKENQILAAEIKARMTEWTYDEGK